MLPQPNDLTGWLHQVVPLSVQISWIYQREYPAFANHEGRTEVCSHLLLTGHTSLLRLFALPR